MIWKTTRRGVALVMVLLLVIVLVVIITQLSYTTQIDNYIARNSSNGLENRYALISAVNYAIAYLQLDAMQEEKAKDKYDALDDVWNKQHEIKIGDTTVTYNITAENSKFNLLHLLQKEFPVEEKEEKKQDQKENDDRQDEEENQSEKQGGEDSKPKLITPDEQFDRLVEQVTAGQKVVRVKAKSLRKAIISWMKDKKGWDDLPGPFQKKTPIFSIKELLLVKGITPVLLNGPGGKLSKKFPGLSHYVTVWSDGKININTAGPKVLQSLSKKIDEKLGKAFQKFRNEGNAEGKKSFATMKEFQDFLTDSGAEENSIYPEIESLITLRSHFFTIEATAKTGRVTKKITVVVYRNGKKVHKIYSDYHD